MKASFSLSDSASASSLSSLILIYLHRARHAYSSIYSEPSHTSQGIPQFLDVFSVSSFATEAFISETSALSEFLDADEASTDKFAAFELKGLSHIAETYGRSSEQYQLAAQTTRAVLKSVVSKSNINLALLTFSASTSRSKRLVQPPQSPLPPPSPIPQQPISGVSTCFLSEDICTNSTNSCTGRGVCLQASKAGKTCFVCACNKTTTSDGKTQTWVGDACERKDISGLVIFLVTICCIIPNRFFLRPFVLLAGSSIALVLFIAGSISLLAGVGDEKLPSTLTGGAVGVKKE